MAITTSKQFFLWDYDSTLFPLRINKLFVEKYSDKILEFVQNQRLATDGGFQNQHRVFATKRGWFLRPTVKLDPVAEFFFYDFIYRNRKIFRAPEAKSRIVFGYRILAGEPVPILKSYSEFKRSIAKFRSAYRNYACLDVTAYFNRIYHHDLTRWYEDAGADNEDVRVFGKFLRETAGGRSINCLPQGLYPAKMVGSAFLGFLENSNRIRSTQSLRMMDDVWLFDDDLKTVVSDFLMIQSLLNDRGLSLNEEKSKVVEGRSPSVDLPSNMDDMKIELLQRRREELLAGGGYAEESDEEDEDIDELTEDEQKYLLSLLKGDNLQEEDAELVLTLMRDYSADVVEFIPDLIRDFPSLSKRLYYFCRNVKDKKEIAVALQQHLASPAQITEFQLFWFGVMAEDYLLQTPQAGDLLMALYEHRNATEISRAKILEMPEKRFGLADLREEQLRTGHSDWLAWASAIGSRVHPKGQRNQLLKYFRKSSPMNQLVGEFVENCF